MEGAASKLSSQPVAAARTTAPARAMDPGRSHARARRTASAAVSFPTESYPRLASYVPYLAECEPEAEFERGLDVLVAGLQALLDQFSVNVPV